MTRPCRHRRHFLHLGTTTAAATTALPLSVLHQLKNGSPICITIRAVPASLQVLVSLSFSIRLILNLSLLTKHLICFSRWI